MLKLYIAACIAYIVSYTQYIHGVLVQDFDIVCWYKTLHQVNPVATRSDTISLYNRLGIIQSIVPTHYVYMSFQ